MKRHGLGRSGAQVSAYCLGAMTFGREADEAESIRIIHAALDRGVDFIDTAEVYADGESETIVGKALKAKGRGKLDDRTYAIVDACEAIAKERGLRPHHVALAWTQACPALSSAIIGARSLEQFEDTANGFDLELTAQEIKRLNAVSDRLR